MLPIVVAGSLLASLELPQLPPVTRAPQITYLDRSGEVLGVRGGTAAPPVDLGKLPPYVPAAFVSIEDKRFYEHGGFDAVGMARALVTDLALGRTAQGASPITQQLARNLFLNDAQTVERKTTELVYAIELEQRYSKQQILSLYLSRVYFGSGAYGIEAASRRFFNKPADKLTVREAAALAAVMKSPVEYSPIEQPERSAERTRLVLDAMVETRAITPAQRARALSRPLRVYAQDPDLAAQYFVDWADRETRKAIGQPKSDLVVQTTLDAPMEQRAATAAQQTLARESRGLETALVALDGSGAVRAMIGGADYGSSQFNRALAARRQAGSAFKPFVYLTAMEAGRTPDDMETDEPLTIDGWSPRNHTDSFMGPITLQTALVQSVNTVAAKVADEVGRDKVAATAERLGITTQINTDPAMALGTSQVTPIDMASAYGAFAAGGVKVSPYAVETIRASNGQLVWRHRPAPAAQVIGNPALGEMDRMMRAVVAEGTAYRAAIPGWDIAGKTGTTTDSKDGWFCGFTGGFAACAWMGRDDGAPVAHLAGGGPPAEEWRAFMLGALPRAGAGPIPAGPPAAATPLPAAEPAPVAAPAPESEVPAPPTQLPPADPPPF